VLVAADCLLAELDAANADDRRRGVAAHPVHGHIAARPGGASHADGEARHDADVRHHVVAVHHQRPPRHLLQQKSDIQTCRTVVFLRNSSVTPMCAIMS